MLKCTKESVPVKHKQNWLQFLFVVKATALKRQMSEFYPHIMSTEASYHIYTGQWPVINVKAKTPATDIGLVPALAQRRAAKNSNRIAEKE